MTVMQFIGQISVTTYKFIHKYDGNFIALNLAKACHKLKKRKRDLNSIYSNK